MKESTLKIILSHCRDEHKLPDIIPSDWGLGVTFKDDEGIEYTTIPSRNPKEPKRIVMFRISSWRGISGGAIHYYGKFTVYDFDLKYLKDGKEHISYIGGYFDRFKPIECKGFDIEVVRSLTQREIDDDKENNRGNRWRGYRAGDETTGFEDYDDLLNLGKRIFKARFGNSWKLEITK